MNQEDFPPVSPEALKSFKENSPRIIKKTVDALMSILKKIESDEMSRELLNRGLEFPTRILESAMLVGEISILDDQLSWACDRLPHDGVTLENILLMLELYQKEIKKTLKNEHNSQIIPYVDWMITWQKEYIKKANIQESI